MPKTNHGSIYQAKVIMAKLNYVKLIMAKLSQANIIMAKIN